MFWMALCLLLTTSLLSHPCVQKVNKPQAAVLWSALLWEGSCSCCGKCSVHKFIRNAFVPGSDSYSSNWLSLMFLTIFSTFVQMFQDRKPVLCSSCLHQSVVCLLSDSFYLSSTQKGSLGQCSCICSLFPRSYNERCLSG